MSSAKNPFKSGVIRDKVIDKRDYLFSKHVACKATPESKLPKKKSIKDKFPKVYYQKYGNCTSNAALACDNYYYHDKNGSWIPSTTFTYYMQKIMDQSPMYEDGGSSIETALKAVKKWGACSASVWPNEKGFNEAPTKDAYDNGKKGHEITTYHKVSTLLQCKKAIASGYPVALCLDWAFKTIDDKTFILNSLTDKDIEEYDGPCHAVVMVGYDDTTKLIEIRNSWSEKWGNKGYGYIRYSDFKKIFVDCDSYAVVK